MPTLDDINGLLEEANAKLNEAMHAIRDLPLEPKRDHMHRVGKALAEIYDIQYHVFALKPELTPPALQGPFDHPAGALAVAIRHASAAEKSGNPAMALAIMRWVAPRLSGEHMQQAQAEVLRLQGKRDA